MDVLDENGNPIAGKADKGGRTDPHAINLAERAQAVAAEPQEQVEEGE